MITPTTTCRLPAVWLLACSATFGCAKFRTCDCPYPPGATPPPPGTYTRQHHDLMHAKARENRFVIYQHEWFDAGDKLGPEGRRHVQRIAAGMAECPGVVVVEKQDVVLEGNETLDQAYARTDHLDGTRRAKVVEALVEAGVPDADALVVVGEPTSEHLNGNEAPQVFGQNVTAGMTGRGNQSGYGGNQSGLGGFGSGLGGSGFGSGYGGSGMLGGGFY